MGKAVSGVRYQEALEIVDWAGCEKSREGGK